MLGVVLCRLVPVMGGVQAVRMRHMGVMAGLFVFAGLVMLGGFTMMVGCTFVMLSRRLVVAAALVGFAHSAPPAPQ